MVKITNKKTTLKKKKIQFGGADNPNTNLPASSDTPGRINDLLSVRNVSSPVLQTGEEQINSGSGENTGTGGLTELVPLEGEEDIMGNTTKLLKTCSDLTEAYKTKHNELISVWNFANILFQTLKIKEEEHEEVLRQHQGVRAKHDSTKQQFDALVKLIKDNQGTIRQEDLEILKEEQKKIMEELRKKYQSNQGNNTVLTILGALTSVITTLGKQREDFPIVLRAQEIIADNSNISMNDLKEQLETDFPDKGEIINNPLNWLSVPKPLILEVTGGKRKTRKNKKKIKRKLSRKK